MAQIKLVVKDFLGFKAGEVKSFSDEICKKFADSLSEPKEAKIDHSVEANEEVGLKPVKTAKREKK